MSDDAWFRESIYLAACEQVFQWPREKQVSKNCTTQPSERNLDTFLGYFQVARTSRKDDRRHFLDFVSVDLRSHLAGLPGNQPDFATTPEFLRSFDWPRGSKPLSALTKWILVTNQGSSWTPFDQHVCAALRIRGSAENRFVNFYRSLAATRWSGVCVRVDENLRNEFEYSIARVFDKFLFAAGSELRERCAWCDFLRHASALTEAERQRAQELADAILASPEAVDLLKGLICDEASEALQQAQRRHSPAPRPG